MNKYAKYKKDWYEKKKADVDRRCSCGQKIGFTGSLCRSCSAKERSKLLPPPNRKGKQTHLVGERNPKWKGDKVGYHAVHSYIRRKYGKPDKCESCGKVDGRIEWANIDGIYLREREHWKKLCKKCHNEFDDIYTKIWISRKKKIL